MERCAIHHAVSTAQAYRSRRTSSSVRSSNTEPRVMDFSIEYAIVSFVRTGSSVVWELVDGFCFFPYYWPQCRGDADREKFDLSFLHFPSITGLTCDFGKQRKPSIECAIKYNGKVR